MTPNLPPVQPETEAQRLNFALNKESLTFPAFSMMSAVAAHKTPMTITSISLATGYSYWAVRNHIKRTPWFSSEGGITLTEDGKAKVSRVLDMIEPIARANGIGGESESPKPEEGNDTPLTDNYFSTKTNLTDAKSFCYHLELRLASSESDLAAARRHLKLTAEDLKESQDHFHEFKMDAELTIQRLRAALERVRKVAEDHVSGNHFYTPCGEICEIVDESLAALAPASSGKGEG